MTILHANEYSSYGPHGKCIMSLGRFARVFMSTIDNVATLRGPRTPPRFNALGRVREVRAAPQSEWRARLVIQSGGVIAPWTRQRFSRRGQPCSYSSHLSSSRLTPDADGDRRVGALLTPGSALVRVRQSSEHCCCACFPRTSWIRAD
jgi:hypothetical protein